MGISGHTALVIANRDDLIVTHGGPSKDTNKYMGWILLPEDRWAPLLNSEPIFDTPEDAEQYMRDLITKVREHMKKKMAGQDVYDYVLGKDEPRVCVCMFCKKRFRPEGGERSCPMCEDAQSK